MSRFNPYEHVNLKLNDDGTCTRLLNLPPAKTNADPSSGEPVLSKDAIVNDERNTKVRLYLPIVCTSDNKRLPVVIYFHGCAWVHFTADNPALHLDRQWTAGTIPAIVILVIYRLAPENRLPAQYEDAEDTLLWTKKQFEDPNGDPWLRNYGDSSQCFISGAGNGGNIVFFAALRGVELDLNPLKFIGLIMNQPLFGGKQRTDSEVRFATDQIIPLPVLDLIWELALPKGTDRNHRYCNPMLEGPHQEKIKLLPPCLVLGFGMDPLIDRQQEFVQMLMKHGVKVEAHFDEVGFHRIDIVDARRRAGLLKITKEFIHTQIAYNSTDHQLDTNDHYLDTHHSDHHLKD
ncbi:probable carboxylesterase 9 [Ricinus communis]|uniref:probable carboxylesterase 9 n=1 Tax=Ricinus communis TaxID=3988 RepID=UPI00201AD8A3|nr:probable carboxylesterase 9 [Ricinus communis]